MIFKQLRDLISEKFTEISQKGLLCKVDVDRTLMWEHYISNFKPEDDPVFRDPNSTSHTCNVDKYFIMNYGNIVSVTPDGEILSMFDIDIDEDNIYYKSINSLQKYIKSRPIQNIFVTTIDPSSKMNNYIVNADGSLRLGKYHSVKRYTKEEAAKFGVVKPNQTIEFFHFIINVPKEYIVKKYIR